MAAEGTSQQDPAHHGDVLLPTDAEVEDLAREHFGRVDLGLSWSDLDQSDHDFWRAFARLEFDDMIAGLDPQMRAALEADRAAGYGWSRQDPEEIDRSRLRGRQMRRAALLAQQDQERALIQQAEEKEKR